MTYTNFTASFKVTADDYGYCSERNRGIRESIENGVVNSVSVLVNGSCLEQLALNSKKNVSFGLHLNLSEGIPITNPEMIDCLVNERGRFYNKMELRERLRLNKIPVNEVHKEIEAQILKFQSIFGKLPNYVDGHQHVHVQVIIRDVLAKCMQKYDITQTRIPSELNMSDCDWISNERVNFNQQVIESSKQAEKIFKQYGISFPSYFVGLSVMSRDLTEEKLSRSLDIVKSDISKNNVKVRPMLIEIMTHPGYPSSLHNGGCSSDGPDEFSCSEDRLYELEFLVNESTKTLLSRFEDSLLEL